MSILILLEGGLIEKSRLFDQFDRSLGWAEIRNSHADQTVHRLVVLSIEIGPNANRPPIL